MRPSAARDLIAGALVIAVGGAFALSALTLPLGTVLKMGSGYFPLIAALTTVGLGIVILLASLAVRRPHIGATEADDGVEMPAAGPIAWRSAIAVLGGVAAFALILPAFGFVPAVFVCALLSAYADRRARPVETLATAAAMAGASWVVFLVGLGIAAPAFRWAL